MRELTCSTCLLLKSLPRCIASTPKKAQSDARCGFSTLNKMMPLDSPQLESVTAGAQTSAVAQNCSSGGRDRSLRPSEGLLGPRESFFQDLLLLLYLVQAPWV